MAPSVEFSGSSNLQTAFKFTFFAKESAARKGGVEQVRIMTLKRGIKGDAIEPHSSFISSLVREHVSVKTSTNTATQIKTGQDFTRK